MRRFVDAALTARRRRISACDGLAVVEMMEAFQATARG